MLSCDVGFSDCITGIVLAFPGPSGMEALAGQGSNKGIRTPSLWIRPVFSAVYAHLPSKLINTRPLRSPKKPTAVTKALACAKGPRSCGYDQ